MIELLFKTLLRKLFDEYFQKEEDIYYLVNAGYGNDEIDRITIGRSEVYRVSFDNFKIKTSNNEYRFFDKGVFINENKGLSSSHFTLRVDFVFITKGGYINFPYREGNIEINIDEINEITGTFIVTNKIKDKNIIYKIKDKFSSLESINFEIENIFENLIDESSG